jgi:hypothetical protein
MQVLRHARTGGSALIDADIDALRLERVLQQLRGSLDELPQFG